MRRRVDGRVVGRDSGGGESVLAALRRGRGNRVVGDGGKCDRGDSGGGDHPFCDDVAAGWARGVDGAVVWRGRACGQAREAEVMAEAVRA